MHQEFRRLMFPALELWRREMFLLIMTRHHRLTCMIKGFHCFGHIEGLGT